MEYTNKPPSTSSVCAATRKQTMAGHGYFEEEGKRTFGGAKYAKCNKINNLSITSTALYQLRYAARIVTSFRNMQLDYLFECYKQHLFFEICFKMLKYFHVDMKLNCFSKLTRLHLTGQGKIQCWNFCICNDFYNCNTYTVG